MFASSLRNRIVAAHALLALAVCLFFAVMVFFARQQIEKYVVHRRLETVAQWRLERADLPMAAEMTPEIAFYRGSAIPPALAALQPGFQEVSDGDRTLDALVGLTRDGDRFVAVDLVSDFEQIERQVMVGLGLCIAAAALLAAVLARATAGRVISPVTGLAHAVRQGSLGAQPQSHALLAREDEIGQLARAFSERTDELQRVLTRERLFTGDVSHELRTPLTVILGAAEVLQARAGGQPELQNAIERIQRTALNTSNRVSALLLLSRAPEVLDAPHIDLLPLAQREVERCEPLLAGRPVRLRLEADAPCWSFVRPELAEMILGNLLRNACLYTEQGEVVLRLRPGLVEVEDSGPGLPASVRSQLFERHVRGAAQQGDGGSGLGLAIVKRIVEHLGWDIRHETPPGGGSRFSIHY
ncbi:MAG TPA: HAMP domain-containing sensor histidine kinase [Roseateles sp.]